MIYIPSPPIISKIKSIFDYPELIKFIKQGKLKLLMKSQNNNRRKGEK